METIEIGQIFIDKSGNLFRFTGISESYINDKLMLYYYCEEIGKIRKTRVLTRQEFRKLKLAPGTVQVLYGKT